MAILPGTEATYIVEYSDVEGRWMAKGPGFFSGGRHATKQQAIEAVEIMADPGDSVEIFKKNGELDRTTTV